MKSNKKKSILIAIAIVFTLLMFLSLIYGLNKPHIFPFGKKFSFNYLKELVYNDEIGIAVDSQGERIILFDKEKNIIKIFDTNSKGSIVSHVNNISIFDDNFYVLGAKTFYGGRYIDSESMIVLDKDGNKIIDKSIADYDENDFVTKSKYQSFLVKKDSIYFTFYDDINKQLSLMCFDKQGDKKIFEKKYNIDEKIFRSVYNEEFGKIYAIGRTRQCYNIDINNNTITLLSLDELIEDYIKNANISEDQLSNITIGSNLSTPITVFDKNGESFHICFVDKDCNSGIIINNNGKGFEKISELGYSIPFTIENALYYFSIFYLVVLVILIVFYYIKCVSKQKKFVPVLIISFILFISIYYTCNVRKLFSSDYNDSIRIQSEQLLDTVKLLYNSNDNVTIEEFQKVLEKFSRPYGVKNSYYYYAYIYNDNNELVTFVDSQDENFSGIKVNLNKDVTEKLSRGENVYGVKNETVDSIKICNYSLFNDKDGKRIGVLEVGYLNKNLLYTTIGYCIELIINLIVILIVVFVSLTTFIDLKKDFASFVKRKKTDYCGKILDATCSYKMVLIIISKVDSVILVLVSQSLCQNMSPSLMAICVALPMAVDSIGGTLGTVFFNIINNKIGKKTITFFASIITIISLLLIVVAIHISSFPLFVIGKFFSGFVLTGIFFGISDFMPLHAKDAEERNSVYNSLTQVENSGSILTVIVGGYLSQYLSYSAIYVFGIFNAIVLFIICMTTFTNTGVKSQELNKAKNSKVSYIDCWKFVFSPIMIIYFIFLVFPRALFKGYGSYLFPLYSASAGLSVILLSNLSVLSKTFTYSVNGSIKALFKSFNQIALMVCELLLTSLCFICFLISPNIYWAIAVLFINDLVNTIVSPIMSRYQNIKINESNVDMEQTTSDIGIVKSVVYAFQSPTLSAIASFGYNFACAVLGVISAIMLAIFSVFNIKYMKKHTVSKNKK